ncbi:MAG TPA: DUF3108 domain-containing protein [Usitatibacter sp.]
MTTTAFLSRYRIPAAALAVSAALHAAVMVGVPQRLEGIADEAAPAYTASLDGAAPSEASAATRAPAPPRRAARPRARAFPMFEPLASIDEPQLLPLAPLPDIAPLDQPSEKARPEDAKPDVVALAQPAVPVPALEPPKFPLDALPASISIDYQLTSSFADGHAVYHWRRDGDNYTITSEAEAVGFFTLFLEGRILQESWGTVTAEGLRPQRFVERKPNTAEEGLEFDWAKHKVTFDRNNEKKTVDLADNTVDWLSMIFQMAHVPPSGETYALRVYTQRKLYKFELRILGEEEVEIPLGKVKALHLRHVDPEDQTVVDVWLGVQQHYLPVKLRYPVARNRLIVEQVATNVSGPWAR